MSSLQLHRNPYLLLTIMEGSFLRSEKSQSGKNATCVVLFGDTKRKASSPLRLDAATWNTTFIFNILGHSENDVLYIYTQVDDTQLGYIPFPLSELATMRGDIISQWLTLQNTSRRVSAATVAQPVVGGSFVNRLVVGSSSESTEEESRPEHHIKMFIKSRLEGSNVDQDSAKLFVKWQYMDETALQRLSLRVVDTETKVDVKEKPYTVYKFLVSRGDGLEWSFQDRFSGLRDAAKMLERRHPHVVKGHKFPSRQWKGNMEAQFISKRRLRLEEFFNTMLRHTDTYSCAEFIEYLQAKELRTSI
eukprot:GILK01007252.1.p1 GENE.GILK01007252.1~~GILK01007252.1.p1  ORF type:complete len:318 (+),score=33.67 GILK01007252.1:44-955(+)